MERGSGDDRRGGVRGGLAAAQPGQCGGAGGAGGGSGGAAWPGRGAPSPDGERCGRPDARGLGRGSEALQADGPCRGGDANTRGGWGGRSGGGGAARPGGEAVSEKTAGKRGGRRGVVAKKYAELHTRVVVNRLTFRTFVRIIRACPSSTASRRQLLTWSATLSSIS